MTFKTCFAVLATFFFSAIACAQQAPNPLDAIPEKMPFDVPYGAPISLDRAEGALNGALAEARGRGWKEVCAVVDSGGALVSFKRMDGAMLGSSEVAMGKARTSVQFRRETKAFEAAIQGGLNYLMTLRDIVASRGGIPLMDAGQLIGAIGCSGGTGSQDELVAKAGVAAVRPVADKR